MERDIDYKREYNSRFDRTWWKMRGPGKRKDSGVLAWIVSGTICKGEDLERTDCWGKISSSVLQLCFEMLRHVEWVISIWQLDMWVESGLDEGVICVEMIYRTKSEWDHQWGEDRCQETSVSKWCVQEEDLSAHKHFNNLKLFGICFSVSRSISCVLFCYRVPESTHEGSLFCGFALSRFRVVVEEVLHPHPKLAKEHSVIPTQPFWIQWERWSHLALLSFWVLGSLNVTGEIMKEK